MTKHDYRMKCIYAVVSTDKYELPWFVGTLDEICEVFNVKKTTILQHISRSKKEGYKCRYVKVGKVEEMYDEKEWSEEE